MLSGSFDDLDKTGGSAGRSAVNASAVATVRYAEPRRFALFDARPLFGESLAYWLRAVAAGCEVSTFHDIDKLLSRVSSEDQVELILFSACEAEFPQVLDALDQLARMSSPTPSVVVSGHQDAKAAVEFIRHGARAFIPTSLDLMGASAVLDFVAAGGTFLPAMFFLDADVPEMPAPSTAGMAGAGFDNDHQIGEEGDSLTLPCPKGSLESSKLTAREAKVLECLCRGKPNKLIAYELALCESTVKMYVGRLMRKLNLRNRTEVALFADRLLKEPEPSAEARGIYSVQPVRLGAAFRDRLSASQAQAAPLGGDVRGLSRSRS